MLGFLVALGRDRAFAARLPGLVLAMVVAELLFKFHSFTLECLAFLATWLAIDVVVDRLLPARTPQPTAGRIGAAAGTTGAS